MDAEMEGEMEGEMENDQEGEMDNDMEGDMEDAETLKNDGSTVDLENGEGEMEGEEEMEAPEEGGEKSAKTKRKQSVSKPKKKKVVDGDKIEVIALKESTKVKKKMILDEKLVIP